MAVDFESPPITTGPGIQPSNATVQKPSGILLPVSLKLNLAISTLPEALEGRFHNTFALAYFLISVSMWNKKPFV